MLAGPGELAGQALAGMAGLFSSCGDALTQSSEISPPSSLSSHWQVDTMPTPYFRISTAFWGALLANSCPAIFTFPWSSVESLQEGKHHTILV